MIKYCQNCYDKKEKLCPTGYMWGWKDEVRECPYCKHSLIDIDFSPFDLKVIEQISNSKEFIEAMIDLKEKDIIEYNLKMSQFKVQLSQTQAREESGKVYCKYCNSTNVKKISGISKASSVAMWGIFSKKIHNEWHCNNCNSDF